MSSQQEGTFHRHHEDRHSRVVAILLATESRIRDYGNIHLTETFARQNSWFVIHIRQFNIPSMNTNLETTLPDQNR